MGFKIFLIIIFLFFVMDYIDETNQTVKVLYVFMKKWNHQIQDLSVLQ